MDTIQWRSEHDRGKFPFAGSATLTNGAVFIAENVFADARLHPYGGSYNQYLSRIVRGDDAILLVVSDSTSGELCQAEIPIASPPEKVVLYDFLTRPVGFFVTDAMRVQSLVALPLGEHEFSRNQTLFSPVVITPMPAKVRSITVEGKTHTGVVYLVGERGVTLHAENANTIVVHADGEAYARLLLCGTDEAGGGVHLEPGNILPAYLESINMVYPDGYGHIGFFARGAPGVDRPALYTEPDGSTVKIGFQGRTGHSRRGTADHGAD